MDTRTRLMIGLASGTVLGVLTLAMRRWQGDTQAFDSQPLALPAPTRTPDIAPRHEDEEPILGYDGMDAETLIDWLERADLDTIALRRVRGYETRHRDRQDVLQVVDDLLG
ncbi:hypothetical protein BH20GEM2_BH20GEM2_06360 [soil metagenome]